MSKLPEIILRRGEQERIVAGHPWIYQSSIEKLETPAADGDVVLVKDFRGKVLGVGFYNSKSRISVRILSPEPVEINQAFFERRLLAALELRRRRLPHATSFRVVNAESDFVSGLIVDKYEDVLVVQTSSLGMDRRKGEIVEVLKNIFSPRAIIERNELASRKFEGLADSNGPLAGELPGKFLIQLNGIAFEVDVLGGHKTGLYLDQQVNYELVGQLAKGGNVLDCFSFLGGFALHCAKAGAANVYGLDQSEDAVKAATANAVANGVGERCQFAQANVFDWLKERTLKGPHDKLIPPYDLIILDPPSFTRTRDAVPNALRGYKEIHVRAFKLLKPGGALATFCCSHHVDMMTFRDVILSAAYDTRTVLRQTAIYTQSPDHPIIPMIPETEYLKGFAFEKVA
jgi:23S rRNA (cytosine1962-C5)-methyltransferase